MDSFLTPSTFPPVVIAHRGASDAYPENTMCAFRAAAALPGLWGMELDVQLSKDGVPMVFHDSTLSRMGAGEDRIRDHTADFLRQIDVGRWKHDCFAGEWMPDLDQVLGAVEDCRLMIEFKTTGDDGANGRDRELVDVVAALVESRNVVGRVSFLSFNRAALRHAETRISEIPRVLNVDKLRPEQVLDSPGGLSAIDCNVRYLDKRMVKALQENDFPVFAYTCNGYKDLVSAKRVGVNAIMTDRPAWLLPEIG